MNKLDESCNLVDECKQAGKQCHICFNESRFVPIKEVKQYRYDPIKKTKKEGMGFEKLGADKYNQVVRKAKDIARRQPNSGAMAHALGDVITEEELTAALTEFKERGSTTAKGAKTISIKKEWLEKLKWEATQMNREYYFLPFRYKDDDTEYVAMEYDILLSYIQTIQALLERLRLLELENGNNGD